MLWLCFATTPLYYLRRGRDSNPRSLSRLISLATSHIRPLCHLSNFSCVFPHRQSLLEIPLYLLLHQGLCTHTATRKHHGNDMLAFQAPPLPRQGQTSMSVKTKKCCLAQSRTVFSSAKNLRNTVIPQGNATFGTAREFMANVTQVWWVETHNPESLADYSTKVQ